MSWLVRLLLAGDIFQIFLVLDDLDRIEGYWSGVL